MLIEVYAFLIYYRECIYEGPANIFMEHEACSHPNSWLNLSIDRVNCWHRNIVLAKHCGLIKFAHLFYKSVVKPLEEFYYSNYEAESEWPFNSIN